MASSNHWVVLLRPSMLSRVGKGVFAPLHSVTVGVPVLRLSHAAVVRAEGPLPSEVFPGELIRIKCNPPL